MALKPCKECKKEISTDSGACPNCGKKSPHGRSVGTFTGLVVIGGVLWLVIKASTGGDGARRQTPAASPELAAIEVTATKLRADYEANEISADATYKNRKLLVSGRVQSIDKGALGGPKILLATGNEFMPVIGHLKDSEGGRAGALKKRESVTLICSDVERIIGSPSLSDCLIQ